MTINDQPDSANVFGEVIESNYVQPDRDQIGPFVSGSHGGQFLEPQRHLVITFHPDGHIALSTPAKLTIYEWKAAKGLVDGLLESIDQHQHGGAK